MSYSSYSQYSQQYKENSIFTASPEELTLMLFNGIIKFIMQAQAAINGKANEKANEAIIKAENIIVELRSTLDMSFEVAHNMDMMYEYMYRRLVEANIEKDNNILDEVLVLAKDFRDTWANAMKSAKHQTGTMPEQIAK